jgi:hypothetical protein
MGKALVIFGADFSANGMEVNTQEVTPDWVSNGFIWADNDKLYNDNRYRIFAFHLTAGQTIVYSMEKGSSTVTYNAVFVQVGTLNGHAAQPTLTNSGVYLGGITKIKTVAANTRFPAIPETEYTASSDETLFICGNAGDTIAVTIEV